MTILFTGYSGFVGRHLLPRLLAEGHRVICLGRSPISVAGGEHVSADLGGDSSLDRVPWAELEAVLHLASAGVKASRRDWAECFRVNVQGTARLLARLSESRGLQRLVLTPTFYERLIHLQPALLENPYIRTKHLATEAARVWANCFGGEISLATVFQAYGPGDDSGNVLSYVTSCLKRRETARLGGGEGRRDWVYVADVAEALVSLLRLPPRAGVQTYDLGCGELHSIRQVAELIAASLGASASLLGFDPSRDRPDGGISLAATHPLPGWQARTTLKAGIREMIQT